MPLNHVGYFTGKNSVKGLIVIHFIFFRVNRTLRTGLCYVLYRILKCYVTFDMIKNQNKPFRTAFLIALGVWENLKYYGE